MNEHYGAALRANENGELTAWLIDYLKTDGRNNSLAEGLEKQRQYCTGLVDYPIGKYQILMGPSRTFRYYETPEIYNSRVDAMVGSLREGWKPVPLIASDIWNDGLELNDGAHRAEALKRFGSTSYPSVFYFKNQAALDDFLNSRNAAKNS